MGRGDVNALANPRQPHSRLLAQRLGPVLELAHGALELLARLRELAEPLAQQLVRAPQSRAHGAFGDAEHLRDLVAGQTLPVVQLERDLQIQWDLLQRGEHEPLLAALLGEHAGRRTGVRDRVGLRIDDALGRASTESIDQPIACDDEEPRAERPRLRDRAATREAGHERVLDQIVDALVGLAAEETAEAVEVTPHQLVRGGVVSGLPRIEQLEIVGRHGGAIIAASRMSGDEPESELLAALPAPQADFEARRLLARVRERIAGVAQPVVLGRYVIGERIGAGAGGTVYAAIDQRLGRNVAIKVIAIGPDRSRPHVLREARALAAISHPNVVEVFDVVADTDHVGIVMQRLHGTNLREWLQIRRARADVMRVFVAVAHGLAAAHARDVCHRDVKPANVIVDRDGRPYLVDFGLAALAIPGVPVGTPAYAAPELMRGQPSDATADQYSFCVALHEALTGVRPRDATAVSRGLPRRWRRALVRGLADDPTQRHASMHALVAELRPVGARGIAAAALVAGGAAAWASWPAARACPSDELAKSGVWTEQRWHAITTSFAAAGDSELADDAITRIEPALRDHVAHWTGVRAQLCDAPPEQAEAALSCLSRARGRLDALLERFEHADPSTVERAMRAVASLTAPEACLAQTQPIIDVATRVALDDARAAYDLGRFTDARTAAEAIAVTAREHADEPALAEARWIEGLALSELGQTDAAIAALSDAYWSCERLALDDVGVRAAASLIAIVGADHADFAGAEQWYRHASARLARGGIDAVAQGQLLVNWGTVLAAHGRPADALPVQLAAIDTLAALGPDHPFLASAHSAAASSLIALARHDEALAHQEAALAIQLRILGPNHPSTALSEQNIGSALLGLGRLAEAEPHLLAALAIQARQLGDDNPTVAVTRTSLGTLYSDQGRLPESIATYERAFTVLRDAGSPMALISEHGLATALLRAGRYDDALPHQLHVVERYSERGAARVETLRARFNLAELVLMRGDVVQARALFEAATGDLDREEGVRAQLGAHVDRIGRSIAAAEARQKEG